MTVMGVLRMIKLFGWESRVRGELAKKRETELTFIWKSKMLKLLTKSVKSVFFCRSFLLTLTKTPSLIIPLLHMIVTYATFVSAAVVTHCSL